MGCFSVCCTISKLTITAGDEAYFIPLIPASTELLGGTMYLDQKDLFMPLCLPIKGSYDDYGSLEDIVHDENTKALEKYFKMSIEDIIEILTDTRQDIYDSFSMYSGHFLKNPNWLSEKFPFEDLLLEIGYRKTGFSAYGDIYQSDYSEITKNKDGSYKIVFKKSDLDFESLKYYTSLDSYDKNENILRIHHIATNTYAGVENPEILELCLKTSGMFILGKVYEEFTKQDSKKRESRFLGLNEQIDNYKQMTELFERTKKNENNSFDKMFLLTPVTILSSFRDNIYFLDIYKELILNKNKEIFDKIIDFKELDNRMYVLNTMYTPMFQGTQCGDPEEELRLHALCCDILKSRIE